MWRANIWGYSTLSECGPKSFHFYQDLTIPSKFLNSKGYKERSRHISCVRVNKSELSVYSVLSSFHHIAFLCMIVYFEVLIVNVLSSEMDMGEDRSMKKSRTWGQKMRDEYIRRCRITSVNYILSFCLYVQNKNATRFLHRGDPQLHVHYSERTIEVTQAWPRKPGRVTRENLAA